jgi:phage recombination protein Bet
MTNSMIISSTTQLAQILGVDGDAKELVDTLKATAFKVRDGVVSDHQMIALLIVAKQYKLNPFTRQLFAFPDKQNGIVPVVSVDGWSGIINDHPQYDGVEFKYAEEIVTPTGGKPCPIYIDCFIYRKDRTRPTVVREYLDEVYRTSTYTSPWQTHTKRFLRHKSLIQCARLAFGFGGIYDQDEAEGFVEAPEKEINPIPTTPSEPSKLAQLIAEVATMSREKLTKDALLAVRFYDGFQGEDLTALKNAVNARRKEIVAQSEPVADIKPTVTPEPPKEPDEVNWSDLLATAKDDEAYVAIVKSMPESEIVGVIEAFADQDSMKRFYLVCSPEIQEKYALDFDIKRSGFGG